jgi:hypothetical protein
MSDTGCSMLDKNLFFIIAAEVDFKIPLTPFVKEGKRRMTFIALQSSV